MLRDGIPSFMIFMLGILMGAIIGHSYSPPVTHYCEIYRGVMWNTKDGDGVKIHFIEIDGKKYFGGKP